MATSSGAETKIMPPMANSEPSDTMPTSSSPVEMSTLPASSRVEEDAVAGAEEPPFNADPSIPLPTETSPKTTTPTKPTPARKQSEALGPATDLPVTAPPPASTGPTLSITLMLITGARHPYKIDERYLRNRNVEMAGKEGTFDPREISGYKLKELIWTDWRAEWEARPASPSSIRLIILGRLVEDKMVLKDFPFKLDDGNVVHMSVKPADFLDDDDTAAKGTGKGHSIRGRDDGEGGAGCRCVIL